MYVFLSLVVTQYGANGRGNPAVFLWAPLR